MALDWKAFVNFGGKDEISGAVDKARKTTEKASKGMGDSLRETGKKADDLKSKIRSIGDIAKGVAIGNLIASGVTKAAAAVKNLVLSVDEFAQRAENARVSAMKIGLSAEGWQKLSYAADSAGVSADKLQAGFNSLNKNLGSGGLVKFLADTDKALLSQVKAAKSNTEIFSIMADAISRETDIAKRSALGASAFGKSWSELYPALSQAGDGIRKIADSQKMLSALNVNLESGGLVKFLADTDKALLSQVKSAKSSKDALYALADAVKAEGDIAKRTAMINAAFGKQGTELAPLLMQGAEGIKKAEFQIPNLIEDRQISAAKLWNSTISDVKKNIQGFGDVIRNAVIQHVGPLVLALKEFIENNRELIKQKIEAAVQKAVVMFKKAVNVVQDLIEKVKKAIQFFKEWGPIILAVGATVGVLWGIVNAVIMIKNAIMMVKSAFAILNAVLAANPIALIIIGVAALIAGFTLLAKKVAGVVPALEVVGQTLMKFVLTPFNLLLDAIQYILPMGARIGVVIAESFKAAGQTVLKYLLTPINLVISGIGGLLGAVGKIPGANWAKTAADGIKNFQDSMNKMLTGSESTLMNSGASALLDPAKAAKDTMADKIAAAEAVAKSGVTSIQNFQDAMNKTLTGGTGTLYSGAINGAIQGYQNGGISGAIKGGAGGLAGVVTESYDTHRAAYLAEHPNEAPGKKPVADGAEGKWDEMLSKFDQMIAAQGATTDAVVDLQDSGPNSPAALRWQNMGEMDFFEIMRLGV